MAAASSEEIIPPTTSPIHGLTWKVNSRKEEVYAPIPKKATCPKENMPA